LRAPTIAPGEERASGAATNPALARAERSVAREPAATGVRQEIERTLASAGRALDEDDLARAPELLVRPSATSEGATP
jgi:hypothetical protein